MKDELGGKIMAKSTILEPKTYCYLTYNNDEGRKQKVKKECLTI